MSETAAAETTAPAETAGAQTEDRSNNTSVAEALGPMIGPLSGQALRERQQEYLESLRDAFSASEKAAESDDAILSEPYRKAPLPEIASRLESAETKLKEQRRAIAEEKSPLPEGEKIRLAQTYANAAEKARVARQLTLELEQRKRKAQEQATQTGDAPQMGFLLSPKPDENPLARSDELIELLGKKTAPTTPDGLTQRLILLNGLPPREQKIAMKKLKLAEPLKLALEGGKSVEIPVLHNGFPSPRESGTLECSTFISATLPSDIRKGSFTTWDFRTMWSYLRTGVPPSEPKYEPRRLEKVLNTASAFEALDLYRGEEPKTGDLLVHRLPWEASGHVFLVREYHRETQIASVIEAAQSTGSTREREFALSLDPYPKNRSQAIKVRAIRPGLMALRLRPVQQKVCTLKPQTDIGRSPASLPQKDIPPPPKSVDPQPVKGGAW